MSEAHRPLVEVASSLEVTADQIRYWLKLSGWQPVKRRRVLYLTAVMIDIMTRVAELVKRGLAPGEAIRQIGRFGDATVPVTADSGSMKNNEKADSERLEKIEKAMLEMAVMFKRTMGDMAERMDRLVQENQAIRTRLQPPARAEQRVIPWHPPVMKDPLADASWWHRAWVRFTAPEKCRRIEN